MYLNFRQFYYFSFLQNLKFIRLDKGKESNWYFSSKYFFYNIRENFCRFDNFDDRISSKFWFCKVLETLRILQANCRLKITFLFSKFNPIFYELNFDESVQIYFLQPPWNFCKFQKFTTSLSQYHAQLTTFFLISSINST